MLEKIVKEQLQQLIEKVCPLSSCQHGFRAGRSTVSNLLSSDSVIADLINDRKPYDIISFGFQRAFDKVPHNLLLKPLQHLRLHSTSLQWIASFLTGRTQRVVLGDCISTMSAGSFGVVQGSVLGPTLFTVFIDPLLCWLNESIPGMSFAFADE